LELRTAGGQGYASRAAVSRRYREAAFIPVQSPSEAQLRWELADLHEPRLARTVITDDLAGDLFEPLSIGTIVRRVADMAVEKASHT
jgi:hypothetical protein